MSEKAKRKKADEAAAHSAPAPDADDTGNAPESTLEDRPGDDLLGSEGADLLPPPEDMEAEKPTTALPLDESALEALRDDRDMKSSLLVTEGDTVRQLEELFPLVWLAMLLTVCYIALYFAIDQLPNRGNPLPGPNMFF